MCARYTLTTSNKDIIKGIYPIAIPDSYKPNYNIAPTQQSLVITSEMQDEFQEMKFGLIPFWAKDKKVGYSMLNARRETILEKTSFKPLLVKNKRCLILADGFYEWKTIEKEKLPYRFILRERELFTFAGLWSQWIDPATKEPLKTFTIITTAPNKTVGELHDRMPVILSKQNEALWLSDDLSPEALVNELCVAYPDEFMEKYRVSKEVNKVVNNHADLILPQNSK